MMVFLVLSLLVFRAVNLCRIPRARTPSPPLDPQSKVCQNTTSVSVADRSIADPGPDPSFLIGRELVFARVKREHTATTEYWPAKILDYVSPTERQRRPKYKIKFMDDIELLADRDMFYSQEQNEFFTCKVCGNRLCNRTPSFDGRRSSASSKATRT